MYYDLWPQVSKKKEILPLASLTYALCFSVLVFSVTLFSFCMFIVFYFDFCFMPVVL